MIDALSQPYKKRETINEFSQKDADQVVKTSILTKMVRQLDDLTIEVKSNRQRLNELKKEQEKLLETNPAFVRLREAYDDMYEVIGGFTKMIDDPELLERNQSFIALRNKLEKVDNRLEEMATGSSLKSSEAFQSLEEKQAENHNKLAQMMERLEEGMAQTESRFSSSLETIEEGFSRLENKIGELSEKLEQESTKRDELSDEVDNLAQAQKESKEEAEEARRSAEDHQRSRELDQNIDQAPADSAEDTSEVGSRGSTEHTGD